MTNANTWYEGPTLALSAGTWALIGTLTAGRAATTATAYTARLGDGTTFWASTQANVPSLNPHAVSLSVCAVVALGAPTTARLQCCANVASSTLYATAPTNGAGATASHLRALRLA